MSSGLCQAFSEEVIRKAQKGDQDAITQLYNLTYQQVYQSVRMIIKDEDTALDVVQDAYIRGFQHLDQLEEPGNFRAWMRKIGVNTAKNYLKKKQPLLFSELEGAEEEESPELQFVDERQENLPEVALDRQETSRLIREILGTLSDDQRLVVSMYYYEEMNAREIADELSISENTVRSRLNYGKKKIEAKVLEIEKRDGIRLHSLAPVPFLLLLFRAEKVSAAGMPNQAILEVLHATLSGTAASAVESVGAGAVAKTAATTAAKTVVHSSAKTIAAKVAAGVLAVGVGFGGGAAYVNHQNQANNVAEVVQTESETQTASETEMKMTETETETETETIEKVLSAQEGLAAFGAEQNLLSKETFTGYATAKEAQWGEATYAQPVFSTPDIPEGWVDYVIDDVDKDGAEELVAITKTFFETEGYTVQENDRIGIEVYEWDNEEQTAVLADTGILHMESSGYYTNFAAVSCQREIFLYGDEQRYIGMMGKSSNSPLMDGGAMEIYSLKYENDELIYTIEPQVYMGTMFGANGEPEAYAKKLREAELNFTAEEISDFYMGELKNIQPHMSGYTPITKIVAEPKEKANQKFYTEWSAQDYIDGKAKARAVCKIHCEEVEVDEKSKESDKGNEVSLFEKMPTEFYHGTGAGGIHSDLHLKKDGSFTGENHFSDAGATGEGYPNGTVRICNYKGKFAKPEKIDTYTYRTTLESLEVGQRAGEEEIVNNCKFIYESAPAEGIEGGKEFLIYVPGTLVEEIPEATGLSMSMFIGDSDVLPEGSYILLNVEQNAKFVAQESNY